MKFALRKTVYILILTLLIGMTFSVTSFAVGSDVFEHCLVKTASEVNIKANPNKKSETLLTASAGEKVIRVLRGAAKRNSVKWDKVLLSDGSFGYIDTLNLVTDTHEKNIPLKKASFVIGQGETLDLTKYLKSGEELPNVYISDNKVISVDESGILTGVGTGFALIGLYGDDSLAGIYIEVRNAPTGVYMNEEYAEIKKSETLDLNSYCQGGYSYSRQFSSSDEDIATVDPKGIVTPKKNGTVTVTVETFNGKTAKCKIKICSNPNKLVITNTNNKIQKGANNHLVTYEFTNGKKVGAVSFIIDDTSVATVDSSGYVTGLKKGKTTLTVKTKNGLKASVKLKVVNDSMHLNKNSTQLALDFENVEKVKYGVSYQGRNLEAFIITNAKKNSYKNTLFMDFAVHGFEDEYFRDGKVLVIEAHKIIDYFARHSDELGNYRLVIVPCANPDGTIEGQNNLRACKRAFGRCTAEHIDINRDFGPFKAQETVALKNMIVSSKPNVYLNVHGWDDEAIGDKKLGKIIADRLGLSGSRVGYGVKNHYAIGWVRENLKIPVALVEYPSSKEVYISRDINMIKAIISEY